MGRFGLRVLESLGADWLALSDSGVDASIRNLALLHVDGDGWSDPTHATVADAAAVIGASDEASMALDFLLLRAIGCVRYGDGSYDVAIPTDAGVYQVGKLRSASARDEPDIATPESHSPLWARVRYFHWVTLHSDPVRAAAELRRRMQREPGLEGFVGPMLRRVRRGHAPRVLLRATQRCRLLLDGRDPSPWFYPQGNEGPGEPAGVPVESLLEDASRTAAFGPQSTDANAMAVLHANTGMVNSVPIIARLHRRSPQTDVGDEPLGTLFTPAPMRRSDSALDAPIDPSALLSHPWQEVGWATFGTTARRVNVLSGGWFGLGLYDGTVLEGTCDGAAEEATKLAERLTALGSFVFRGLMALSTDLRQLRVTEHDVAAHEDPQLANIRVATRQSVDLLTEFFEQPPGGNGAVAKAPAPYAARPGDGGSPSRTLLEAGYPPPDRAPPVRELLERRMLSLDLADFVPRSAVTADPFYRPGHLLQRVEIGQGDFDDDGQEPGGGGVTIEKGAILLGLRRMVSRIVEQLMAIETLESSLDARGRQPPRLSVFVVGDLSERLTCTTSEEIIVAIHAELMRVYGNLFKAFRSGFQRTLSIVPLLWTSDGRAAPAESEDAHQGAPVALLAAMHAWNAMRLRQTSVVQYALHSLRRRVEGMPSGERCVPVLYVNSRITDRAVLSVDESVQQTHDFLSLMSRQDVARDELLRRLAVGPFGRDFFATFACREIAFPSERGREYAANRFARRALFQMRGGGLDGGAARRAFDARPSADAAALGSQLDDTFAQPQDAGNVERSPLSTSAVEHDLVARCTAQGTVASGAVAVDRVTWRTPASEVKAQTGPESLARYAAALKSFWLDIAHAGSVGSRLEAVRQAEGPADRAIRYTMTRVDDADVALLGTELSLATLRSRFGERHTDLRARLVACRSWAGDRLGVLGRSRMPSAEAFGGPAGEALAAARRKPDTRPMLRALAIVALASPVVVAPIAHAVALKLELPAMPGFWELALGRAGAWVWAAPLLALTVGIGWMLLTRHVTEIRKALRDLASTLESVYAKELAHYANARVQQLGAGRRLAVAEDLALLSDADERLVTRIARSCAIAELDLRRHAESLAVQPDPEGVTQHPFDDDVRSLFSPSVAATTTTTTMVDPSDVVAYYLQRVGTAEDLEGDVRDLLDCAGGTDRWRRQALFADRAGLLSYGRTRFAELVEEPDAVIPHFERRAIGRMLAFHQATFGTMGFAADFCGYEGLDTDGVLTAVDAQLLVHPEIARRFELFASARGTARLSPDEETASMLLRQSLLIPCNVRRSAGYMVAIAQGLAPEIVRNLRRYESELERRPRRSQSQSELTPLFEHRAKIDDLRGLYASVRRSEETSPADARPGSSPTPDGTADIDAAWESPSLPDATEPAAGATS